MAYKEQYKKESFLQVIDQHPKATTVIAKSVGCARNTARKFLEELEAEGKVKQVQIEGGFYAWVKAESEVTLEGIIPDDGCIKTGYAGKRYKLTVYDD